MGGNGNVQPLPGSLALFRFMYQILFPVAWPMSATNVVTLCSRGIGPNMFFLNIGRVSRKQKEHGNWQ